MEYLITLLLLKVYLLWLCGVSTTAECNTLKTVESSPEKLRITSVVPETIIPGCQLPKNMSGHYYNVANNNANVTINETHIIEIGFLNDNRRQKGTYICQQQIGTRFMMTQLTIDGCESHVCFEFIPRHHNIIRYRKGMAMDNADFNTVCSWERFTTKNLKEQNETIRHYDYFIAKNPVPIKCPVAGNFEFNQTGDILFETKISMGVTLSPRPNTYCMQNISDFSVYDQNEIAIDVNYCLAVDHLGRPVPTYSDPDYRMKCIGYWKENEKSYLITYDWQDPYSEYQCWVYRKDELYRILMSKSFGPICDIRQTVQSNSSFEGAFVSIIMMPYERIIDKCPMYFNDGSNPWAEVPDNVTDQIRTSLA